MTHIMVVGTSEPQDLGILEKGQTHDFTGIDIDIEWRTAPGGSPGQPTVAWLNQSAGTVRMTGCEDMPIGTYSFRFTLEDSGGKIGYAPNPAAAAVFKVVRL